MFDMTLIKMARHRMFTAIILIVFCAAHIFAHPVITNLDVPSPSYIGDSVRLICNYNATFKGEPIDCVEWFHDNVAFYRYRFDDWPPGATNLMSSLAAGFRISTLITQSNRNSVFLQDLTEKVSGIYKCEVRTKGPSSRVESTSKEMLVKAKPKWAN